MVGPKLDARSYTNLILVVIAMLMCLNLFAQRRNADEQEGGNPYGIQRDFNPGSIVNNTDTVLSEAAALREVAQANMAIARSTDNVAAALRDVAKAIGSIDIPAPSAGGAYRPETEGSTARTGSLGFSAPDAATTATPVPTQAPTVDPGPAETPSEDSLRILN